MLSSYILSKKATIFDSRNIKLALVKDDPLGDAFGVAAFHRCQVNSLLRQQLIPVHPNCRPDELVVTTTSDPGLGQTSQLRAVVAAKGLTSSFGCPSLPAFPSLSKAASSPASLLPARKRSNSSEHSEEEAKAQKQRRQSGQCSVIVRRSNDSDVDSDTETIYSEQGYETVKATEEEEEEAALTGSDMDTTREGFDEEYDIDSGEEEERPPQVEPSTQCRGAYVPIVSQWQWDFFPRN